MERRWHGLAHSGLHRQLVPLARAAPRRAHAGAHRTHRTGSPTKDTLAPLYIQSPSPPHSLSPLFPVSSLQVLYDGKGRYGLPSRVLQPVADRAARLVGQRHPPRLQGQPRRVDRGRLLPRPGLRLRLPRLRGPRRHLPLLAPQAGRRAHRPSGRAVRVLRQLRRRAGGASPQPLTPPYPGPPGRSCGDSTTAWWEGPHRPTPSSPSTLHPPLAPTPSSAGLPAPPLMPASRSSTGRRRSSTPAPPTTAPAPPHPSV